MAAASQSTVVFEVTAQPIIAVVILIEIGQGITDILDFDVWTDRAEVERVDLH
jgi:hypothetical protein